MKSPRRLRLGAILALGGVAAVVSATAASAGQVTRETIHHEASYEVIDFLGIVEKSTGRSDDFCEAAVPALT